MHLKKRTAVAFVSVSIVVIIVALTSLDSLHRRLASAIEPGPAAPPPVQEREREEEGESRERTDLETELIALEKALDEVEARLEKADDAGDDQLVERLEEAAEEIEERIESIERRLRRDEDEDHEERRKEDEDDDDEDDDEEDHEDESEELEHRERELELRLKELQIENMELELRVRRFETMERMIGIAENPQAAAAWAVVQFHEHVEEEDAIETLDELLEQVDSPLIRRLVRLRLVELYREIDRPHAARRHLLALILGEREGEQEESR